MTRIGAFTASATLSLILTASAWASDYPERPIEFIVPFNPGGQTDIASRVMADGLARQLGVAVSVINRDGAGGAVGTAEIAAANTDGYRIGITTSTPLIMTPHRSDTPYEVDSFDYICRVYSNPLIMVVNANSPYESIDEIISAARSGTQVAYGSVGAGSVHHVAMEQLMDAADFESVQVQSTSDANNVRNLLADVTTLYFLSSSVYRQNEDVLRPVAVMDTERMASYPDVPAVSESGYDVLAAVWGTLVAPRDMDQQAYDVLHQACADVQATEDFQQRLTDLGMDPVYMSGEETAALARDQSEIFGNILSDLGLDEQ